MQRDIQDAANILAENSEQLSNSLEFDAKFVESHFADWIAQVADPTRLELDQLAETARIIGEQHTGEITGPGTLICQNCGENLKFEDAGHGSPLARSASTPSLKKSIPENSSTPGEVRAAINDHPANYKIKSNKMPTDCK